MYRAKSLGKNRYVVFEQSLHDALVQRLELDADLRRALDRDEFELHYQPILDLGSGRVEAVEALVRWRHPERGLVPPLDFIPIAEETGLIHRLGLWVLREACREAAAWQAESRDHAPVAVTVNLSGRQLQQPDLVAHVSAALADHGLEPASLILEITETVLMHDTDGAIETLQRLKDLGVRIAIDDFGTGYSSLRYLSRFPADILKIAKPFVDALGEVSESDAALTQAIVGLGSILEVETVAEGIEERVQEDRLRELGCTFGQGFLFSRPVVADEIRALLRASAADERAA
jgi:EAL domain-containing protein (putative c-di-GMP-specific phosphodiesterase class I)